MKISGAIICVCLVMSLSACTEPGRKTGIGAAAGGALGAGVGAIVGSSVGHAGSGLVIGAAAGAGAGAAVGNALEAQEKTINNQEEALARQSRQIAEQSNQINELKRAGQDPSVTANGGVAGYQGITTNNIATGNVATGTAVTVPSGPSHYNLSPEAAARVREYNMRHGNAYPGSGSYTIQNDSFNNSFNNVAQPVEAPTRIAQPVAAPVMENEARGSYAWNRAEEIKQPEQPKVAEPAPVTQPVQVVEPLPAVEPVIEPVTEPVIAPVAVEEKVQAMNDPLAIAGADDDCVEADKEVEEAKKATSSSDRLFHFRRAERLCPNKASIHNDIGETYLSLQRNSDAEYEFGEALRLDPGFTLARENLKNISNPGGNRNLY